VGQLVVVSQIKTKPGQTQAAIDALQEELEESHGEPGILKFALHQSPEDPANLMMIEVYRDEADLESHYQQPHFAKLVARLDELFDGVPTADRFVPLAFGETAKGLLA
jgi:quinol monooxygenase YgiN